MCVCVCITNVRIVNSSTFVCLFVFSNHFQVCCGHHDKKTTRSAVFLFLDSVTVNTVVHTESEACQNQWYARLSCTCTCACVFVRVHVCLCVSACVCACVCVRASVRMRLCVSACHMSCCVRVCVSLCVRACVCVCTSFPPQSLQHIPRNLTSAMASLQPRRGHV